MSYPDKPERIEQEINRTRERIEQRLNSLGTDITPTNLVQQALGGNPGSTGETLEALVDKARANPLSALLVGAGLAGLFLAKKTDERTHAEPRSAHAVTDDPHVHGFNEGATPSERIGHNVAVLETRVRGAQTNAAAAISDAVDTVTSTASSAANRVSEAYDDAVDYASSVASSARPALHDARESVTRRAGQVPTQARSTADYAVGWVKENPVPAGMMALAVGATVASIFTTKNASAPRGRAAAGKRLYEQAERDVSMDTAPAPAPAKRRTTAATAATAKVATTGSRAPAKASSAAKTAAAAKKATTKRTAAATKKAAAPAASTKAAAKKSDAGNAAGRTIETGQIKTGLKKSSSVDRATAVLGASGATT